MDSCVQTKATASAGARMLVRARLVEERYAEVLVNTSFDNPFVVSTKFFFVNVSIGF